MKKTYSFLRGLGKGLTQLAIFSFPFIVEVLPAEWMNLTVGGMLSIGFNYLKFKYKAGTPNQ